MTTPDNLYTHEIAMGVLRRMHNFVLDSIIAQVPARDHRLCDVQSRDEFDCDRKMSALPSPHTIDKKQWGSGNGDGRLFAPCAASCADTFGSIIRKQIGTKLGAGYAGFSFNRQHELGRHSLFRGVEPIPDERLPGADLVRQPFLAAGKFTCALECFD